jgi:hypothetical protein
MDEKTPCPFWPYCQKKVKNDLSTLRKSKVIHIVFFITIAVVLTVIEERRLAVVSISAVSVQGIRLLGEIFADRIFGENIFTSFFRGGE